MNFVDWASALVLLVVGLAGLYGAAMWFLGRRSAYDGTQLSTRGLVLLCLLYLGGALVSCSALILLLTTDL